MNDNRWLAIDIPAMLIHFARIKRRSQPPVLILLTVLSPSGNPAAQLEWGR